MNGRINSLPRFSTIKIISVVSHKSDRVGAFPAAAVPVLDCGEKDLHWYIGRSGNEKETLIICHWDTVVL